MEILTVKQIQACEEATMDALNISSLDLVVRAGRCFTDRMRLILADRLVQRYYILCGPGKNGADGLAIAKNLCDEGEEVWVVLCYNNKPICMESQLMLQMLRDECRQEKLHVIEYNKNIKVDEHDVVVDALFGIGLNKPLGRYYESIICHFYGTNLLTFSVDVPSGMFIDEDIPIEELPIVCADYTLTFQYMKFAFLLPQNAVKVGTLVILDIGLITPRKVHPKASYIMAKDLLWHLNKPRKFDHKGVNGHGLLVAGSASMPGSAILAAKAAMRGGIGKLTVHSVDSVANALPIALPEAVISRDKNENFFTGVDWSYLDVNAIAVGPGLGRKEQTAQALKHLIETAQVPLVLDADALNILAENPKWLELLPKNTILTPHVKEFDRLFGNSKGYLQRLKKAQTMATKYDVIIILKGAYTCVAVSDWSPHFNSTGNPGMATAGSGDVLTGLLLALLAKGYSPSYAAIIGVYLHGLAGDIAAAELSTEGLIASDIANQLAAAQRIIWKM